MAKKSEPTNEVVSFNTVKIRKALGVPTNPLPTLNLGNGKKMDTDVMIAHVEKGDKTSTGATYREVFVDALHTQSQPSNPAMFAMCLLTQMGEKVYFELDGFQIELTKEQTDQILSIVNGQSEEVGKRGRSKSNSETVDSL